MAWNDIDRNVATPEQVKYAHVLCEALYGEIQPVKKRHPKYPNLGIFHYCVCGALFAGWGKPEEETNFCGNCGQKIKGEFE